MDTTISFSSIDRIGFLKKSSFWHGFTLGFAASETPIVLLTASEDNGFAQVFIFIIGNILIVAPTSIMSGIIGATPYIRLDISEENFHLLHKTKLNRYVLNTDQIRVTSAGLDQLDNMRFPNKTNRSFLQLDYSPKYYLQLFEPGIVWANFGSQTVRKYSGNYDESHFERPLHIETTVGFAWSPSMNWEFGGQFSTNHQKEIVFTNNDSDHFSSVNFSYSYYTQNIYALRRFSPYQNGYGDRWQFNLGTTISHTNLLSTTYISANNEFTSFYDERSKLRNLFGLGLVGSIDCYLTKHFSLCVHLQNSWFNALEIDGFSQETYNVEWDAFTINPMVTTLSLGLRGQF